MAILFSELWRAHDSHRLDPKYHLFKREERKGAWPGWEKVRLGDAMRRREDLVVFSDPDKDYQVMTIGQTGEIRVREAGKGRNYPEWKGSYFQSSPGKWYAAKSGDVVFSSIDLWKGCIAVVPPEFDGALVTGEFPIYELHDRRISAEFLQILLRSRYYQRAFRAITTGHSNRRRTQVADFEALEIAFPNDHTEQARLTNDIQHARTGLRAASHILSNSLRAFNDHIDGRGDEELPELDKVEAEEE
jgi:type I restriction enzyme M protein